MPNVRKKFLVKIKHSCWDREHIIECFDPFEAATIAVDREADYIPNGDESRCGISVIDENGKVSKFQTRIRIDVEYDEDEE